MLKRENTNYRYIRDDEPLWIIVDIGNTDVKAMVAGRYSEEIVFPHSVQKLSLADYQAEAESYNKDAKIVATSVFKYNNLGYKIGEHARMSGKGTTITGSEKYIRDHYGAMFAAAANKLYPAGHADVHVIALHPPRLERENRKNLRKALKEQHLIATPDDALVSYNVSEIILLDEPVAALQTFILGTSGRQYANPVIELRPGSQVLILDVGGGLSAFVPGLINRHGEIEINYSADPINAGIENVKKALASELKVAFTDLRKVKAVPDTILTDALHGSFYLKGVKEDCTKQLDTAMAAIASPLKAQYINDYASGVAFSAVIITGGGGAAAFEYLKTHVLDHNYVFSAEPDLNNMRFGAIRGASKGLTPYLSMKETA